jgi:hypothetical protein
MYGLELLLLLLAMLFVAAAFTSLVGDGGSVGEGQSDPLPDLEWERFYNRGPYGRPPTKSEEKR